MKIECDRAFAFNPFDGFENGFGIEKKFMEQIDQGEQQKDMFLKSVYLM